MTKVQPKTTHLKDYRPPAYLVERIELRFELGEESTRVDSRLSVRRNAEAVPDAAGALVLDGESLELEAVKLDGERLDVRRYSVDHEHLTIQGVPERFTLDLSTRIRPQDNTSLDGLYKSSGNFCTQCEAEGFRKISYHLDRPDVMSRYSTTIVADRDRYPVMLSNGNPVARGDADNGRHWIRWEDPYPKPSYLFALVAGKLHPVEDRFVTASGREVKLRIYVEAHNLDKCEHAMRSLKHAMRWDEEVFGLEYDLDIYMIVAVDDFNMGAMENKGLNVFNSKYVLARPDTATDSDYAAIEGVIAHEYFHNWTGNRVTCRDWFQLSLKEGLTVFRDQEFSADMASRAVNRIKNVRLLRTTQFSEDAGPMAHPVRPASYIEISNFYTTTVYNKGAEVIRMMHTLLGAEAFRRGMDLYFQRHDGQAVTTDDFVQAMQDASGIDLAQFRRWYEQAGTPELSVTGSHDAATATYTLRVRQTCPPTPAESHPGESHKEPFHIPLAVGLLGPNGDDMPVTLKGENQPGPTSRVLDVTQPEQEFVFKDVATAPVPSLLRGYSAPVKLDAGLGDDALGLLLIHDSDAFTRWDAGQELATRVMLSLIDAYHGGRDLQVPISFVEAIRRTLASSEPDRALIAEAITLPGEEYLSERMPVTDVDAIHQVRNFVRLALAGELREQLLSSYYTNASNAAYRYDAASAARRSLKNVALGYLMQLDEDEMRSLCFSQFRDAENMTDVIAALQLLANSDCEERKTALAEFLDRWRDDPLVLDKWFAAQATSRLPDTLDEMRGLMRHPTFNIKNPNRVRALIGAFCFGNPIRFHDASGNGYEFLADRVLELDRLNPQVAARLLGALARWRKFDPERRLLMKGQLERILAAPGLSRDSYEVASKTLGSNTN